MPDSKTSGGAVGGYAVVFADADSVEAKALLLTMAFVCLTIQYALNRLAFYSCTNTRICACCLTAVLLLFVCTKSKPHRNTYK